MLFLDTSAIVKRYVDEPGTDVVVSAMEQDPVWAASAIARVEAEITLGHRGLEASDLDQVRSDLDDDWDAFLVVPVDADCLDLAAQIGCDQRLRTVDAIHLAAAARLPGRPMLFTFDERQRTAASALGMLLLAGESAFGS